MRRICYIIILFLCFALQGCEKADYQENETVTYVNSSETKENEDTSEIKSAETKETNYLYTIIDQNQNMIEEYLKCFPAEMKWFGICWFDFTNDGKKELVLAKEYLASNDAGLISYQYVYDQQGNDLFTFLSGSPADMDIYTNHDSTEFYICSQIHWGSNNNTYFYSKIVKQEEWKKEFVICEWDTRKGGVRDTTEGYHLFLIPLEKETDLFCNPYEVLLKMREDEDLKLSEGQFEEYLQFYKSLEKNQPDLDGIIYCSENEIIMEIEGERKEL